MIRRRDLITLLGGAAALPLTAAGQQQKPISGWLDIRPGVPSRDYIDGFRRGLVEIGFVEGRDVTVEYHTADGHLERLPSLAEHQPSSMLRPPRGPLSLDVESVPGTELA
jgi:putative ABC transport system substrate-binding protein